MSHTAPASAPVVSTARPSWVRWQIVAILVSFSFMTWFNRVSMSVAYDERIQAQTGISPEAMGYVYSAFLFAYMVCMTPGGWLIDRYGPWAALVVMGFGSALLGALTGAAGLPALVAAGLVLPALLVIRSVMGMLTAPVYPASSRVVALWMPPARRAWANGLVQGAAAVGIACAFPVFGWLMDWVDWQVAFVVTGAITALLAVAWAVHGANGPTEHRSVGEAERRWIAAARPSPPTPLPAGERGEEYSPVPIRRPVEEREGESPVPVMPSGVRVDVAAPGWQALLSNHRLILLTLSYAAVGYVEYLFFFWMHYYFEKVLHLGTSASRFYAAVLTLAMAGGMVLGGWAADRLARTQGTLRGRALVVVVGLCAGGVLLVLGVLAQETAWIVTLLALALAAVGAAEAPVWTTAVELGGPHGGTAAGICNTGGNAGGLLAPILTPLVSGWISRQFGLSEQAGWQWGISLGSGIALAGAVLWYWIIPGRADQPAAEGHSSVGSL